MFIPSVFVHGLGILALCCGLCLFIGAPRMIQVRNLHVIDSLIALRRKLVMRWSLLFLLESLSCSCIYAGLCLLGTIILAPIEIVITVIFVFAIITTCLLNQYI